LVPESGAPRTAPAGLPAATVYRLCDTGELPHLWIVNSIRIRPSDLQAFLDRRAWGGERGAGPV